MQKCVRNGGSQRGRLVTGAAVLVGLLVTLMLPAGQASATTIQCCSLTSDATPVSQLSSTFDFSVAGAVLTLVVDNDTVVPNEFNINEIYFNTSLSVTTLTLTSAAHSDNSAGNNFGNVFAQWEPVLTNQMVDGLGVFDFALNDGMGELNPAQIGPGEDITFVLDINGGVGVFDMGDFGPRIAAKFVNGPDDPESPGDEDSAFGAIPVPEPSTVLFLASGLAAMAAGRRRRAQ